MTNTAVVVVVGSPAPFLLLLLYYGKTCNGHCSYQQWSFLSTALGEEREGERTRAGLMISPQDLLLLSVLLKANARGSLL